MEHNSAIRTYMAIIAERDTAVRERNMALDERRRAFAERDMAMLQRDAAIAERNSAIEERDKAINALQMEDDDTIYDNDIPHNYTMYDPSEIPSDSQNSHGPKLRKCEQRENEGGASSTKETSKSPRMGKQGSDGLGQQVKVGSSKVWGSDALNMMM